MADEFVDFYEILELPLEAERSEVRKRISELYIEAQKNLDHRNFNTRVRYQQLFEVTLPQARYILLDDGRRDDYDRLVRASRASAGSASATSGDLTEQGAATERATGARARSAPSGMPGEVSNPNIGALPDVVPDPQAVEQEREELWNKWKSGLQSAMEREVAKENAREIKTTVAAPTTPLADRIEAAQSGAPQPQSAAASTPALSKARSERPKVRFDFDEESPNASAPDAGAPVAGSESGVSPSAHVLSPQQIEERRVNQRREIIRAELENTGVKASFIGAAVVLVPGVVAMTIFMSTYYPPNKISELPLKSSAAAWLLWLVVLSGLAYGGAHLLSKSLRRKQALQLQLMSYEELLRHTKKDI